MNTAFPAFYTLSNRIGTQVDLCAYGARIAAVRVRDRAGELQNIALSFPDEAAYNASGSFAGAIVGPVAGRIAGGRLFVLGQTFLLKQTDGENTLHGGAHNLSNRLWAASRIPGGIAFSCSLADGLEGFPGNRHITVQYTLSDTDTLRIRFVATTDKPTVLNLTSHVYWNLGGDFSGTAYGQTLEISSDAVYHNDASHLPVSLRPTRGTAFDFSAPRRVSAAMESDPENAQLINARGYNNAYALRPGANFAARLIEHASGRRMTLRTDYPYLVFYSGGFLPNAGCALALEAQYAPNTCELVVLPGETYRQQLSFQFDTV